MLSEQSSEKRGAQTTQALDNNLQKIAVSVHELKKKYTMGEIELMALSGDSFQIEAGESVGIVGESGSGKSTLLHILGALDSPTSGQVVIGGLDPFVGSDLQVSAFRNRHVGFVFQHNNLYYMIC